MATQTRREKKQELQRQEILAAARELFLTEGRSRFSMRKLAQAVGCVPGTLYLYFENKETLLALLVEESFEALMDRLEASARNEDPLEVLESIMRAYIDFGLAYPDHYYFAFMLPRSKSLEKQRPRPHRSYAYLCDVLSDCLEQEKIKPVDLELATQRVWTGIHGVTSLMITIPNFDWGSAGLVVDDVIRSLIGGLVEGVDRVGRKP